MMPLVTAYCPTLRFCKPRSSSARVAVSSLYHPLPIQIKNLLRALSSVSVSMFLSLISFLFHWAHPLFSLIGFCVYFFSLPEITSLFLIQEFFHLCQHLPLVGFLSQTRRFLHPSTCFCTKFASTRHLNTAVLYGPGLHLSPFLFLTGFNKKFINGLSLTFTLASCLLPESCFIVPFLSSVFCSRFFRTRLGSCLIRVFSFSN